MKRTTINASIAAFALAASLSGGVQATVLTFDTHVPLAGFDDFPTAYGDNVSASSDAIGTYQMGNGFTPNVTVDYRTRLITTNEVVVEHLDFWDVNYGGLTNVVYNVNHTGHYAELTLVPEAGWAVKLNSFNMAGFSLADHADSTVRIVDGSGNVLVEYASVTILGAGSTYSTFTPNLFHNGPVSIRFGFDDWNVGIDNVNFDQVAAVPEPAAYGMLLAGLGFLALASTRRRINAT